MNKMHNEEMINRLLEVVQGETKPAIGCTEPVAVALAAATARKYLKEDFKEVNVKVSKNIFKNGKSVIMFCVLEEGIRSTTYEPGCWQLLDCTAMQSNIGVTSSRIRTLPGTRYRK